MEEFRYASPPEYLIAGFQQINPRAFGQAGRRDPRHGPSPGRGPMTPQQRSRIINKNRVLKNALDREREAFNNPNDPQIDGVPESLTRSEMNNRFRGLERKPKYFNPKQEHIDFRKDIYRLGKKATEKFFQEVMNDPNFDLEHKAALQTATNKADILSKLDRDYLREGMRDWWDSRMVTMNARLRRGDTILGLNRDGTFKIRGEDGKVRNDNMQREGYGEVKMMAPEMLPRGAFGDFTNEELYRWNIENFAPDVDPGAAIELMQPIDRFDEERWPTRQSGMFPPL